MQREEKLFDLQVPPYLWWICIEADDCSGSSGSIPLGPATAVPQQHLMQWTRSSPVSGFQLQMWPWRSWRCKQETCWRSGCRVIYSLAPDLHPWDQLGDYFSLTIHLTTRTQVKSQPLRMHRVLCTMQTPLISLFLPPKCGLCGEAAEHVCVHTEGWNQRHQAEAHSSCCGSLALGIHCNTLQPVSVGYMGVRGLKNLHQHREHRCTATQTHHGTVCLIEEQ